MRWGIGLLMGALIVLAESVAAQQTEDSLAFRKGQWGAEFAAGTEARSLGVLRFLSPRRALVLDGTAGYFTSTRDEQSDLSSHQVQLRVGLRWFRDVVPRVRQYFTVGVTGGVSRSKQEYQPPDLSAPRDQTTRGNIAGAFANVGGMWQTSPHLALGANWEASYTRTSSKATAVASDLRSTTHGFSMGTARLVLSLLF